MRCPFGCREVHRKRDSTRRSTGYYRTKEGRQKKRVQNGKRRQKGGRAPDTPGEPKAGAGELKAQIVEHVRMAASLIEGRRVSREEILKMLARALRQRSLVRRRRIDYIVGHLNKASP